MAALTSSDMDNSFELESASLAGGTVDEMVSCNRFFPVDNLHLRNASIPMIRDIAIL
jgi:hypothetical protein